LWERAPVSNRRADTRSPSKKAAPGDFDSPRFSHSECVFKAITGLRPTTAQRQLRPLNLPTKLLTCRRHWRGARSTRRTGEHLPPIFVPRSTTLKHANDVRNYGFKMPGQWITAGNNLNTRIHHNELSSHPADDPFAQQFN